MKLATFSLPSSPLVFFVGLLIFVGTGFWNIGIIAVDDYASLTSYFVPAQSHSVSQIISQSEIRSPFPRLILFGVSSLGLLLGLNSPISQLRFVLVNIAIGSFLINAYYGRQLLRFSKNKNLPDIFLFLLSFYFLCPLFLTRSMLESLSAPFALATVYYGCAYWNQVNPRKSLALSALFLSIACFFRLQMGVCALALLALPIARKRFADLGLLVTVLVSLFCATGLLDGWMRGGFHHTLFAYVSYNFKHSASYGVTPFYSYLLLFVALTLPPTFLSTYRGFKWSQSYRPLIPAILFFAIFVGAHSAIGHKEERFMIPVLSLFLVLLCPLLAYFLEARRSWWRLLYFVGLNFLLLGVVTLNIPQNNVIGLVKYLEKNPSIREVLDLGDSVTLFPTAFLSRPVEKKPLTLEEASAIQALPCDQAIVVQPMRTDFSPAPSMSLSGTFRPGWAEALIVKLNPNRNARRSQIVIYRDSGCL